MKALSEANRRALDRFSDGLWLADGLARNTLESYRRDLAQFAAWLDERHSRALLEALPDDLQGHLAWQVETRRAKPRTTSRLVSSLRRFFQFAVREGLRADDPANDLESPKLPRALPKSLSEAEVEALLAAPDVAIAQGLRDRAMLETLYASGLRVSRAGRPEERAGEPRHGRGARAGQGRQGTARAARRGVARMDHALPARGAPAARWRDASPMRSSSRRAVRP